MLHLLIGIEHFKLQSRFFDTLFTHIYLYIYIYIYIYLHIIKFDHTDIEEYEFHQPKSPILINDIDINKIVVSNKLPFGKQIYHWLQTAKKLDLYAYFVKK